MSRHPSPAPRAALRAALRAVSLAASLGLLGLLLSASLAACGPSSPLLDDLDERQALAIAALLDAHQIPSAREPSADPKARGRWRLRVPDNELTSARALLLAYGLPPPPAPPAETDGGSARAALSLLPSADDARAQRQRAQQRALEDTLGALRGVTFARVHLSDAADSAAVLLRVTPDADPDTAAEAARLLGYAIPSVAPERVHVTAQAVRGVAPTPLVALGPWYVARGDAAGLQRLLIALTVCATGGLSAAIWLGWRLSRVSPAGASPAGASPRRRQAAASASVVSADVTAATARPLAQPHAPTAPR